MSSANNHYSQLTTQERDVLDWRPEAKALILFVQKLLKVKEEFSENCHLPLFANVREATFDYLNRLKKDEAEGDAALTILALKDLVKNGLGKLSGDNQKLKDCYDKIIEILPAGDNNVIEGSSQKKATASTREKTNFSLLHPSERFPEFIADAVAQGLLQVNQPKRMTSLWHVPFYAISLIFSIGAGITTAGVALGLFSGIGVVASFSGIGLLATFVSAYIFLNSSLVNIAYADSLLLRWERFKYEQRKLANKEVNGKVVLGLVAFFGACCGVASAGGVLLGWISAFGVLGIPLSPALTWMACGIALPVFIIVSGVLGTNILKWLNSDKVKPESATIAALFGGLSAGGLVAYVAFTYLPALGVAFNPLVLDLLILLVSLLIAIFVTKGLLYVLKGQFTEQHPEPGILKIILYGLVTYSFCISILACASSLPSAFILVGIPFATGKILSIAVASMAIVGGLLFSIRGIDSTLSQLDIPFRKLRELLTEMINTVLVPGVKMPGLKILLLIIFIPIMVPLYLLADLLTIMFTGSMDSGRLLNNWLRMPFEADFSLDRTDVFYFLFGVLSVLIEGKWVPRLVLDRFFGAWHRYVESNAGRWYFWPKLLCVGILLLVYLAITMVVNAVRMFGRVFYRFRVLLNAISNGGPSALHKSLVPGALAASGNTAKSGAGMSGNLLYAHLFREQEHYEMLVEYCDQTVRSEVDSSKEITQFERWFMVASDGGVAASFKLS